ncbi:aminotransferase class I/II-fold pyridoxal phosphate-dependent enzyme [Patescibacteria group bacterium]|nr:aminotransferase class I/II-fold pyridoxal phosphate-dependent enzyme [Patescibacteria group bacterium]
MKFYKKPIFTGFAPNLTWQDTKTASSFLFFPWKWCRLRKDGATQKVEAWLKKYFESKHSYTFDSGRTALHYALKACGIKGGDEVLVQSYTCMVVSNAITWTGAKPIYIDIKNDFNMDPDDLANKITDKSKVLIIQHTFGKSADLGKLVKIAHENNLKIIEDCAHSFGATYQGKKLGTFGDLAMFSFGSDKVVSCVRGGGVVTNNEVMAIRLREFQNHLPLSRHLKVIQHLFHYIAFTKGKSLYNLGVGKWILGLSKKLNIMNRVIYNPEKYGKQVLFYPSLLPNSLATILLKQLKTFENVNKHRQEIARLYNNKINTHRASVYSDNKKMVKPAWSNDSVWLRYTLLVENPAKLHAQAKKQGIILGNWYNQAIAPKDIDLQKSGYIPGSCPNAEKLSSQSINLPTNRHITTKDAERIIKIVNHYYG